MTWPSRAPRREQITDPDELQAYDSVVARMKSMGYDIVKEPGYFGRLMHSPLIAGAISEIGRHSRAAGDRGDSYSHADREWVNQVLAMELNSEIVQHGHLPDAIATGVRLEAIEALRAGRDEDLTDDEALLTEFIRRTLHGKMNRQTWEMFEARSGERSAIEYAVFVLFLQLTMRMIACTTDSPVPTKADIDREVAEFKAGRREIPNFRDRIR